jgi:glyoxylase-like metal-dependent hydrolase (beta-lactamase superfamily II)
MLVVAFPAAAFDTNCYLLATGPGEECVIVDPGVDTEPLINEALREHHLRPVAVMLTHGHLDHVFAVTPVCGALGISAWIHPKDRHLLADPMLGVSEQSRTMFGGRLEWTEPDDVQLLEDQAVMELAGLQFTVDHAPGHTAGSVMFHLPPHEPVRDPMLISGDVLFQGSIGRTDLPGGSHEQMMNTLATKVLPLPDRTIVFPGHGDPTQIGIERKTNPYLTEAGTVAPPSRGL